jgi:hypothetical protein
MAKFKADSDVYYGRNAIDTKGAEATASFLNKNNLKTNKGENVVATAAGGETQAQIDKRYDDAIKSGKMVPYNDPSIDDETRRFLKGATYGADLSRSAFDKGLKIRNYNEIYEDDFNPEIWEADAKKGKDSRYGSGSHYPDKVGMYTRGVTPVKPGEYVPIKLEKIDPKNVDWKERKVEPVPLKGMKITQKEGKLALPKEKEELSWKAPMPVKKKGLNIGYTKIKPGGKTGIKGAAHPFDRNPVRKQMIKYNTEKRQSAAYFSGKTSIGDSITGKDESELRQLKKETRGEAGRMLKEGRLGSAATIGKDLGTIRKAIRYAKKGDISVGSVGEKTGVTTEGKGSKLRYFTPEFTQLVQEDGKYTRGEGAMYGYKEYQAQEKDKAYRAQNENPANRNTTWDRIQSPNAAAAAPTSSFSSSVVTRGQMKDKFAKDNPTASRKEIRQGVQKEASSNKQLMKDLRETEKKKGMY